MWLEGQPCNHPACQASAHYSTPTTQWPVFSRSLGAPAGHAFRIAQVWNPRDTCPGSSWRLAAVGGFQHPTQMKCYFRLCSDIWTFLSTQHHSTCGSVEASACAHLSLTCTLSWRWSFRVLPCSVASPDHVESAPGSIWTLHRASVWLIGNVYDKTFSSSLIQPI